MTAEQKNYEDTTRDKEQPSSQKADKGPTIPRATPRPGERVYERQDREAKSFVLVRPGGPVLETITRRETFDMATGKRIDDFRCSVGQITEDKVQEMTDPLPDGIKHVFTRIYYRLPPGGAQQLRDVDQDDKSDRVRAAVMGSGEEATSEPEAPIAMEDAAERMALEQADMEIQTLGDRERKRLVLDDVPVSMKKPKLQETPVGVGHLPMIAMVCVNQAAGDHWMGPDEVRAMSRLLGRKVTGVRIHAQERKKLYDHRQRGHDHRASIMFHEAEPLVMNIRDDAAAEGRDKVHMAAPWRGMTVFYQAFVPSQTCLLDTPAGCVKQRLSPEEMDDVKQVYAQWCAEDTCEDQAVKEIFALVLKANQKELNPKCFDGVEKQKFQEADIKEWTAWIKSGSIRIATPEEEAKATRDKVISAPMRHVRTNKDTAAETLEAKSRMVIRGDLDPQLGSFRTDAPTVAWMAVFLVAVVGLSRDMEAEVFDVAAAFLSGVALDREIYCRAPAEGLPAACGWPQVPPYTLLRILKGAFGLTEAPRLWYLRARGLLKECGFTELRCARAVFTLFHDGLLIALLALHVDDGMLWGLKGHPRFKRARAQIDKVFNIKQWIAVRPGVDVDYLGVQWHREGTSMTVHMDTYIGKLEPLEVHGRAEDLLSKEQVASARRLLAQLRWPISHCVPELSYELSKMAQTAYDKWTVGDLKALSAMVGKLTDVQKAGRARFRLRKMDLAKVLVVTPFDANFGRQEGHKSQLGFFSFLAEEGIETADSVCALVEFGSSVIHRVVRSTLAAEAAALSTALDRQLYLRLVLESLMFGEPDCGPDWRHKLKIKGLLVTDAKSLFDHLGKTGSVPKEKQTLIDLLVARDLMEAQAVRLRWVPTDHMLADVLTKVMKLPPAVLKFLGHWVYCIARSLAEAEKDAYRLSLRQGQRQRRKEKRQALSG